MQAAGNPIKICLYHDYSHFGQAVQTALGNRCTPRNLTGDGNYLYQQYFIKTDQGDLTIDVKSNCGSMHYSLLPKEKENPDILFVFSRCAALNKSYKVGDLVIVDQPYSPLNRTLQGSKVNLEDLSKTLPELPVVCDFDLESFLTFISMGQKKPGDVKKHFKLNDEKWSKTLDGIIIPNENKYWKFGTNYLFELTEEGKAKVSKYAPQTENEQPRKPAIHVGTSYFSGGLITSYAESTQGKKVDVIDQISHNVFNLKVRNPNLEIINVCAVQCKEEGDLEAMSSITESVGKVFLEFMLKVTEKYQQQHSTK